MSIGRNLEKGSRCDLVKLLSSQERDYLIRNNGDQVKIESLHGKIVGIYFIFFNATCEMELVHSDYKTRTRNIIEAYNQLSVRGDFEIVFVATQSRKKDMEKCKSGELFGRLFSTMPWLAIPHFDFKARMRFAKCEYSSSFLFIDKQGVVGQTWDDEQFTQFGAELYPFTKDRFVDLITEGEKTLEERTVRSFLSSPSRDYVISNTKERVPISELEEKVVGLYFYKSSDNSAKELTPILIEVYKELKNRGENFEIVMINLHFLRACDDDDNEQLFEDEFKDMPWLALPYKDSSCRKLMRMFRHYHFDPYREPMDNILVIVGPGGNIFDCNGASVLYHYGIDAYPFTAKAVTEKKISTLEAYTLESVLDSLDIEFAIAKYGEQILISHLVGKSVILFLGGKNRHWDHELKQQLLDQDYGFQVIYVSKDNDLPSFHNFISEMPGPWLTLPLDIEKAESLIKIFHVTYCPCLVAFGPEGRFLTKKTTDIPLEDCGMHDKYKLYDYSFNEAYSETQGGMVLARTGFLWDGKEDEEDSLPKFNFL